MGPFTRLPPRVLLSFASLFALAPTGCIVGVTNGEVMSGPVVGKTFTIGGYARLPGTQVRFEVLEPANQDPFDPSSTWTALDADTVVSNQTGLGPAQNLYLWETALTIAPDASETDRWSDGGLARIRAFSVEENYPMAVFDDMDCVFSNLSLSGMDFLDACQSPDSPVLTLVSDHVIPEPRPKLSASEDRYLSARSNTLAQATVYYDTIEAPQTFEEFKDLNGFGSGEEVNAQYFNEADLGFGRDMHCRQVKACDDGELCAGQAGAICDAVVRTACYVTNYGDGNFDSHHDALADIGTIFIGATVAMTKNHHDPAQMTCQVPVVAPPPTVDDVQFFVYNTASPLAGSDPVDSLLEEVQLEARNGQQAIPGLCVNCHGGNQVVSPLGTFSITGAKFLPFDVDSYLFSADAGITRAPQQEAFQQLNAMVLDTELEGADDDTLTPSPIAELVMGWYGGVEPGSPAEIRDPAADFDGEFVPDAWEGEERLYQDVVAPSCRLCHLAFEETNIGLYLVPTWSSAAELLGYGSLVTQRVCEINDMPHSRRTFEKLWRSGARATLVNELGYAKDCAPPTCSGNGSYNPASGLCQCVAGFSGFDCQLGS